MKRIVIRARGHPNITARHRTTLMITKDPEVGPRGDCIVGVCADKSFHDFPEELRRGIIGGKGVRIKMTAGGLTETVHAYGDPSLTMVHPSDIVVRKSSYICGRTLAIKADKSSGNLSRPFVEKLRCKDTLLSFVVELI
ncbi:MAG: DUF371 domain-containing protein [Candidatus Hadarchaeales archaeon]